MALGLVTQGEFAYDLITLQPGDKHGLLCCGLLQRTT